MKIAFVNDSCERLGIEYISAILKQEGHEAKLFVDPQLFDDENISIKPLSRLFDYKKRIMRELKAYNPALIGISVVTDFYQWASVAARMIKKEFPDTPIVFGGIHPTSVPERVIKNDFVDMVCVGEGEYSMLELANSMEKGRIDYSIQNLWFKKDGQIIQNPLRPLIKDLDSLPFPDKYLYYSPAPHFSQCYYIMASRGCAYSCSYCCHSYLRKLYKDKGAYLRQRSVENVISELEKASKRYPIKTVRFHDDDLLAHSISWLKYFSYRYSNSIKIPFTCFVHPNTVIDEKARLLREAGCYDVEIGIQSISGRTREMILNRHVTHSQLVKSINTLKKYGLRIITDNILGIPGQETDEIVESLKFHNENRVMKIHFFGFRHYPKTDIIGWHNHLEEADIIKLEEGINVAPFSSGGDMLNIEIMKLQTFAAFLLFLPKRINKFLIDHKLYRFFPPLPYFIRVIFSAWLRIPYKYNWSMHILISRYCSFIFKTFQR